VASGLPEGIAAVALSETTDSLETCLVWRTDERSPSSPWIYSTFLRVTSIASRHSTPSSVCSWSERWIFPSSLNSEVVRIRSPLQIHFPSS
jgi:hypothetical protein